MFYLVLFSIAFILALLYNNNNNIYLKSNIQNSSIDYICIFRFRLYIYSLYFFLDIDKKMLYLLLCRDRRVSKRDRGEFVTTLSHRI